MPKISLRNNKPEAHKYHNMLSDSQLENINEV